MLALPMKLDAPTVNREARPPNRPSTMHESEPMEAPRLTSLHRLNATFRSRGIVRMRFAHVLKNCREKIGGCDLCFQR